MPPIADERILAASAHDDAGLPMLEPDTVPDERGRPHAADEEQAAVRRGGNVHPTLGNHSVSIACRTDSSIDIGNGI